MIASSSRDGPRGSWGFGVGADGRVTPHAVRAPAPADRAGHLLRLRAARPGRALDGWRPEP